MDITSMAIVMYKSLLYVVSMAALLFWIQVRAADTAANDVDVWDLHGGEVANISYSTPQPDAGPRHQHVDRGMPDEQRLMKFLFEGYERTVRPVRNASSAVIIRMGLTLTQIFDMDEKDQVLVTNVWLDQDEKDEVLVTNVWLDQEWYDEFMVWDPDEFANITMLRIPCHKLWLPDIVLYNNAAEYTDGMMPANAMVQSNGNIFWPVPTKLQSSCKVDVTYFPFDEQTCSMKFGSWTYDGYQVDITNRTREVDLSNYVNNGEWQLLSISIVRNVVIYACCVEPFPDVTFTVQIRRRTLYYMYNVIFPCIMMSALTLLVFCLPPDSGEKIALGITVLLAFSVFMLAVAENLPETSEFVPLISIYLTTVMALTSMSVVMTVFVLNLHHRGPNKYEVPRWIYNILINKLAPFLCLHEKRTVTSKPYCNEDKFIKNMSLKITLDNIHQALQNEVQIENNVRENVRDNVRETIVNIPDPQANCVSNSQVTQTQAYPTIQTNHQTYHIGDTGSQHGTQNADAHRRHKRRSNNALSKTNEEILQSLRRILEKHEREDKDYEITQEWRKVAQVMDRILFIVFMIATVSSTVGVLLIAPATQ